MNIIVMETQTAWTQLVHTLVHAGKAFLEMDFRAKVKQQSTIRTGFKIWGILQDVLKNTHQHVTMRVVSTKVSRMG